jgi:hypothetical protein
MRLSEAIRLGSTLSRQVQGIFSHKDKGTCALGAAFQAVGGMTTEKVAIGTRILGRNGKFWRTSKETGSSQIVYPEQWNITKQVRCPVCRKKAELGAIITFHLNDKHDWTREAIADWLELEEGLPVEQLEAVLEVESAD